MSEYFRKKQGETYKLSEYLEFDKTQFKGSICDERYIKPRIKYIMDIIGDVELPKDTCTIFLEEFQRCGGKYDVRTKPDTILGMYEIASRYPQLAASTIEMIWSGYIKDLYEEFSLVEMLGKYIDLHGETSDAIEAYFDFVERKAQILDEKFELEAKELEEYKEEYGEQFIKRLQLLIKDQHISSEQVKQSLPSKELVEKDKEQLNDIVLKTRIFMGMCEPISYQMIESIATGEGLERFPEQPAYLINGKEKIDTTFTKEEFLTSIKKRREETAPKQLKKI